MPEYDPAAVDAVARTDTQARVATRRVIVERLWAALRERIPGATPEDAEAIYDHLYASRVAMYAYPLRFCKCGCGARVRNLYVPGHQKLKHGPKWEVDPETGCWIWLRAKGKDGYGSIKRGKRSHRAHRWVYEQEVGPIPEGLELDHLCRNPSCVNPEHLEPVTKAENQWRGVRATLTFEQAQAIRQSTGPARVVAARYGVSETTVWKIRRGESWQPEARSA